MTRYYPRHPCPTCGMLISNNGMGYRSHDRGAFHIAALRARNTEQATRRADGLQVEADAMKVTNKRRRDEGTYH